MAFDEIKENLAEADASVRSYLENSREYYKLKVFKFLMQGLTASSKIILVGTISVFALLFLSLAASYGIGQYLDSTFLGFLSVGLFYLLAGILIYLLRRRLNKPILQKFSEFYFDEL